MIPGLLSVIMPAYNSEALITEALESVAAQTYRPIEIIVIDDGSSDTTMLVSRRFADRANMGDHGDLVVRCLSQENSGPSRARNAGLAVAEGEFVSMLDADDHWSPWKAEKEVAYLKTHRDVSMVFGDAQIFSHDGIVVESLFKSRNYLGTVLDDPKGISECFGKLLDYDLILTGTEMIRRECLFSAGLYDESFRYAEDIHLWLRIAARHKIGFIPEIFLFRRLHETNSSRNYLAVNSAGLRLRESLYEQFPEQMQKDKVKRSMQIANMYFERGYFHFQQGQLVGARKAFFLSMGKHFNSKCLAYYCSTFLGISLIEAIRKLKNHG